jgi:hypothetical protein
VIEEGESIYAVSYPPAMYAQDILNDRDFAAAMGYAWLHDDDTDFARSFREQVRKQAEIYQQWLAKEEGSGDSEATSDPAAENTND